MANRIAEHKDVLLPLMVCQDGFITSHSIENIELIEDEKVKEFVGKYEPEHYLLNPNEPIAVSLPAGQGKEFKEAMDGFILEVKKDIKKTFNADEFENVLHELINWMRDHEQGVGLHENIWNVYEFFPDCGCERTRW